ncbi:MAG: endolytic transglycosylase MltG [Patescibacteria group bacterium]
MSAPRPFLLFSFALGAVVVALLFGPAQGNPTSAITIEPGTPIRVAAQELKAAGVVRSALVFELLVRILNPQGGVIAGIYSFPGGENAFSLAYRFSCGDTGITPVRVTVPEGFSTREIGILLTEKLGVFDENGFTTLAAGEEGYLFPDTYLMTPGMPPEAVIALMRGTFEKRVRELEPDIEAFGKPLKDVVIMASLLEKEARQEETRRTVAGILWKRLDRGMPLQVDAVFGYILATTTFSPTFDQLTLDSPYNTYKYAGLPPGPIANPGLVALKAAVTPVKTPYLFYLTGVDGTMRYARTLEEHKANRKYLR